MSLSRLNSAYKKISVSTSLTVSIFHGVNKSRVIHHQFGSTWEQTPLLIEGMSLENASSFSPVPGPAMLVVLEPAVEEEAVVGSGGAAASASLRLSFIMAILGGQTDAVQMEKEKDQTEW
ncbi:hypothetical protein FQN60_005851, partial [Etheostoma spectabile]